MLVFTIKTDEDQKKILRIFVWFWVSKLYFNNRLPILYELWFPSECVTKF